MIRHEARTSTIRESTGVTEDRIRKLYRAYLSDRGSRPLHRRRGKSPRQTHCLTHNLKSRTDAALFAGLLHSMGVSESLDNRAQDEIDVLTAARICDAYELFIKLRPAVQPCEFTFEHAWFLVRALRRGTEISAAQCSRCMGLTLRDIYSPLATVCPLCETMQLANSKRFPGRAKTR